MRTVYAVTDQRVLVLEHRRWGVVRTESFGADALIKIKRKVFSDGSGNLIFETRVDYDFWSNRINFIRRGFFGLRSVREVEAKIQYNILRRMDTASAT